jgi:uncharacterized protein (TIGR02646 family)
MRHFDAAHEPRNFRAMVDANPGASWAAVDSPLKDQVLVSLLTSQDFVCAYCERPLTWKVGPFVVDSGVLASEVHVEHFHPQKPKTVDCSQHGSGYDGDLDWTNLLAVCDGLSNKSCDKRLAVDNVARCGNLLHPRELRGPVKWFVCGADGKIEPAPSCPEKDRASRTIEWLGLNCATLVRLRSDLRANVLQRLRSLIEEEIDPELIGAVLRHEWKMHGLFSTIDSVIGSN